MESRTSPGIATLRHHNAVLGCLRQAGFSVKLTAHAYAALDSYIYGFVMQELNLPLGSLEENAELIESMLRDAPIGELGYLVEFSTHHVLKPGYDFGDEFDYGLALILDGLESAFARESEAATGVRAGRRPASSK